MLRPRPSRLRARLTSSVTAAVVTGVLAVAVQAIGSWIPSLWGDEAASLLSAERSVPSLLLELTHVDAVHGVYYLFLHYWIQVAGTSPFAIRFPSAVAVGACVVAVVLIGARMRSLPVGIAAGVICAVLPRTTYIGEEARSYAFSAAIAAWLTLLLIVALSRRVRVRRIWVAYGVLLAAGIDVFLYLVLLAVAHGIVLLVAARRRGVLAPWAVSVGSALVAASPLIVAAIFQRAQISYLAQRDEVTPESILVSIWFDQVPFAVVGWTLVAAGVAIAVVVGVRRRSGARSIPIELLVAAWFLVPSAVLIGTSPVMADFTPRYLSFCAPAVALLMVLPFAELAVRWRPALVIGTAAVVVLGAWPWAAQRGPYAKNNSDWSVISGQLARVAHPGDAVVFDDAVRPSRRTRLALRTYPLPFALRNPTLRVPYWRNTTWYDDVVRVRTAAAAGRFNGVDRVWVVEYAIGAKVDRYGIADLERLGFHRAGTTFAAHRSRILEFVRP